MAVTAKRSHDDMIRKQERSHEILNTSATLGIVGTTEEPYSPEGFDVILTHPETGI